MVQEPSNVTIDQRYWIVLLIGTLSGISGHGRFDNLIGKQH
jgi:hypothetical protein